MSRDDRGADVLEGMRAALRDRNYERLAAVASQVIGDERFCCQEAVPTGGQVRGEVCQSGCDER
jgi:hypothetical protein